MKIIKLSAENVKRLRAVEITPDGNTVIIAGRNAQGKSSVLDAIWMALAGGSGSKETSRPIRDGEEKASVTLDLGDLIVTRRWTQKGTTLEVTAAEPEDGGIGHTTGRVKYSSPQAVLDGLIGRLSFDPLAFAQQDAKGQLAMLLSVVDLPFDPATLDGQRAAVYSERTDVNREVKRLEAQVAGLPEAVPGAPTEEVSAAELMEELQAASAAQRSRDVVAMRHQDAMRDLEKIDQEILELQQKRNTTVELTAALYAQYNQLPEPPDQEQIRARISSVDETNTAVRASRERTDLETELDLAKASSDTLTAQLEEIDRSKAEAIAAAKMPLEGLSFDADGVLYNGVPFSQSSAAERLRVGIAMAMALNPTIRVIRITDGSLLDSENLALIEQMAGEHDFQVWIERVDETGSVGITIEDGAVQNATA